MLEQRVTLAARHSRSASLSQRVTLAAHATCCAVIPLPGVANSASPSLPR